MRLKPKTAEVLLLESEARYRRLFETAQDGILLLDAESEKITDANQFLLDLLGYAREELIGKKLWDLGFLKDIKAAKEAFEILQQTGYVRYDDLPLETKSGRHMEVEFISNVYLVGSERVIQCNIRDVSERKRLDRLKDSFISTVSHEIRTPLAVLKMGVDHLEASCMERFDQEESETIEAIKRNVERLERLIDDLLDLSRLESGKTGPALKTVQIDSLIQEVIQNSQSKAKERGIVLKDEYEKDLPPLMADPDLLERVMSNLLDNALRFAKSHVTVITQKMDNNIQISVINDGSPIKAEHIPTLFNKFIQFDRPYGGDGYKGTGLGLAICSEIIKLHRGKIWAESMGERGVQFHFGIPLKNKDAL